MGAPKVDLLKNRKILAIGGAAGAGMIVLALLAWPALVRPEPPLEAAGDDGLRIKLVEPPKAALRTGGPLDVGLSEAAEAVARGRDALFSPPPQRPAAPAPRPRSAPVEVADADEDDLPPAAVDDQWRRDAERRDQLEQAQRRRWEDEAQAREARDEREAWEREMRARQRWEEPREGDRYVDRYAPPPPEDPPPRRW